MDDPINDIFNTTPVDFFAEMSTPEGVHVDKMLGGTGERAKIVPPRIEVVRQKVSDEESRKLRIRTEKSKRIADDLKPQDGSAYKRQRVDEMRNIEMRSEQGDIGRKAGLEELVFDARGYKPSLLKVEYTDTQGQTLVEELVRFAKEGENGQTEYLRFPDGQAVGINASLYRARLRSNKHAQGIEYDTKMIPRVGTRGEYTGIVTLIEDKDTMPILPSRVEPVTKENEQTFSGRNIREELEKPINLNKLPATEILAMQLNKNQTDILRKAPDYSNEQMAFNLALRFFEPSLYQRISEQAIFGPKEYERFDDPAKLTPILPEIRKGIADAEQTIVTQRPSARILRENGWLYVDQGKQKTDYRIYLSPDPLAIGKVFSDIALTVPENVRYQMKTFDAPTHAVETSRLDKIIVYAAAGDFDIVMAAIHKVYLQNQTSFQDRPAPGGGVISPVEGISVAKQPKDTADGRQVTGTQEIANSIGEKLDKRLREITKTRFSTFHDATQAGQSKEGKVLFAIMQQERDLVGKHLYLGTGQLTDTQRSTFVTAYLHAMWNASLYNYTEGRPVSIQHIRQTVIKSIQSSSQFSSQQMQYLLTENMSEFQQVIIDSRIMRSSRKTGLAIAFGDGLAKGQTPGTTFEQLLTG